VYLGDNASLVTLARVAPALPAFSPLEHLIPSQNGSEVYVFDNAGRHLRTVDAFTRAVKAGFAYDAAGRLSSITNVDGQVTTIERDSRGGITGILAPFGQRTQVQLDDNGYASNVVDPAGGGYALTYTPGGLLSSFTDPRGGTHQFTYDGLGRLMSDEDPVHSIETLSRTGDAEDSTVTVTTQLGRTTLYRIQREASGREIWTNTLSDNTQIRVQRNPDGTSVSTDPDGTETTRKPGPDPRFGLLSPVSASLTISTPGGLVQTQETRRTSVLGNPSDPTSLVSETETFALNGKSFTRTYNAAQKTITVVSPLGRQSVATVDNQNRVVNIAHPSVAATQATYDPQGRIITLQQGARQGGVIYDSAGYVTTASDALGLTTSYDHDPLGQVTQMHRPDGDILAYSYNAATELLTIRPPGRIDHSVNRDTVKAAGAAAGTGAGDLVDPASARRRQGHLQHRRAVDRGGRSGGGRLVPGSDCLASQSRGYIGDPWAGGPANARTV
jgi:YD repeat-containing protein